MNRNKNEIITVDIFFYIGMLLITFDSFPFSRYGLGSGKPLSVVPLIVYIVLKLLIEYRNNLKFRVNTIVIMFIGILILLDSLCQGLFVYDDLSGFLRAINMFAVFYITFLGFELFIKNANRKAIYKMFLYIYKSFSIALFFGIIEIVYFYIIKADFLKEFVLLFVRDDVYLSLSKLQFNFGEAGNTSVMIGILFPLTLTCLKKMGYSFKTKDKLKIGLIILLSIFSLSLNYLIISMILIMGYMFIRDNKYKKTKIVGILFLIIICLVLGIIINSGWFYTIASKSNLRLLPMLVDRNKIFQDGSIQTRLGSSQISLYSFINKPIFGYGWGYYTYAFRENFEKVNNLFKSWELIGDLKFDDLQNFGFIFSLLSEAGVLGISFLMALMNRIKNAPQIFKPFIIVIIVEMFQNVFVYWISLIVAFCICTSISIKNIFE